MNNQSLLSQKTFDTSEPREQGHLFQRIARAWLRISGPPRDRFGSSLEDQERLRRSRILSALFPFIIVASLIAAPTAIPVSTYWFPIASLLVLSSIAFLLNRAALVNLSGLSIIFAIDSALVILIVTLPTGIRNSNIPDFDLFLISTLIGGIILPRRLVPFLALFHIALIVTLFAFFPHDPLLTEEIRVNQKGLAYGEISDAWLLQIVGGFIAWLNARSVDRALLRASKAEELAQAQKTLQEQVQQQMEQKERLEHGIAILKEAHARFSNGDYRARANLLDNELAPLAFSFNLMAERLNRIAQTAQEHTRLEQAFQQLIAIQEGVVYGGTLQPFTPTGTVVDRIYLWLKQYYQLRQMYLHLGAAIEKLRLALTRQRTLLAQLASALDQTHAEIRLGTHSPTASLDLVEKAQQLCGQVEEQGKTCLQETKQLDQLLKVP